MFSSPKPLHVSSNYFICGSATVIFLMFLTDIASSNKNNFNSVHHKTKEAESKVNELFCYSCDINSALYGDDCLNINQTRTRQSNLTKKCAQDEIYCSVKRFSYTMSDKNSTSEKKLWTLQRDCKQKCENSCIIIGERLKIHACQSCCTHNLCNVGSSGSKINFDPISNILFFFIAYAVNFS